VTPASGARHGVEARRVALVGPLAPWRGGLAQYLAMMGEALSAGAEVLGITFTRQYPGFLFPGTSQLDPAAPRPSFPVESMLDSIAPWSWRRVAARLEQFAPGAVVLKWWMPFFAPAFASSVGPLRRRGTRVVLVCDNLVPHEHRPLDGAFTGWMLRNSDGYLVMSDSVERDLDRGVERDEVGARGELRRAMRHLRWRHLHERIAVRPIEEAPRADHLTRNQESASEGLACAGERAALDEPDARVADHASV